LTLRSSERTIAILPSDPTAAYVSLCHDRIREARHHRERDRGGPARRRQLRKRDPDAGAPAGAAPARRPVRAHPLADAVRIAAGKAALGI
jgi:hypothetical protein